MSKSKSKPKSKPMRLIRNSASGVDLITEMDIGNEIRIRTGKADASRHFWLDLSVLCRNALEVFEEIES